MGRNERETSRRDFLKLAATGAGVVLGGSLSTRASAGTPVVSEDLTKYKGVELNLVSMPGGSRVINDDAVKLFVQKSGAVVKTVDYPMSEMITKYATTFLSGRHQYDVVALLNENMSQFYNGLYPLDEMVADPGYKFSEILPSLVNEFRGPDGKLYGIPIRWGSDIIHYRKDLFEKYKVKVPTTWDEYFEAAKALTVDTPEGKVYGTDLKLVKGYPGVWHFAGWLWSSGGDLTDAKYEKAYLDTERAAAAAEVIRKLLPYAPPGAANVTQDEQITNFSQGRTAMSIAWSPYGFYYQNPKQSKVVGRVGWALPPRRLGDKTPAGVRYPGSSLSRWSMMSAWGYCVTKTSPNKEAAAALVRFLASAEAQRQIAIAFGNAPVRESIFQEADFRKALKDKTMDGWAEVAVAAGKAGYAFLGYNGHHAEMIETVQVQIQEACVTKKPVKDLLKEAQTNLEAFLQDVVRKSA
jgi:ABC-type glycerol-3-phosphate transport system substrate-binding protein